MADNNEDIGLLSVGPLSPQGSNTAHGLQDAPQGSGRHFGYVAAAALLMLGVVLSVYSVSSALRGDGHGATVSDATQTVGAFDLPFLKKGGLLPGGGIIPPAQPAVAAPAAAAGGGCVDHAQKSYALNWHAEGTTFFDEWEFLLNDPNQGAAQYVDRAQAIQNRVIEAGQTAIMRAGPKGANLKRMSAKIETTRKWKYFLMAIQMNHVPWGCGIWPAFWTRSPDVGWPNGGELDIIESTNEQPSRSSFHVGIPNRCQLNPSMAKKPGCTQFIDVEMNNTGTYDCVTNYPTQIGCAPNVLPLLDGQQLSAQPSVIAVEWTEDYIKIFRIPTQSIPADLAGDAPQPDTWDQWVIAYYPFAASEQSVPGSCPNHANLMAEQKIVLSLGFCGDWASKVWENSTMCANKVGFSPTVLTPHMPDACVAVDPHNPLGEQPGGPRDCCTQYIVDQAGQYGTEATLQAQAYWDISWMKVYQDSAR